MTNPIGPTSALPPTPTGGVDPPPVWFNVPDGFFALPLATTPEERAERAELFVRALYSRGDETIWTPAAPYYAAIAELMTESGVSYSAMGLFSTAEESGAEVEDGEQGAGQVWGEGADGVAQCAFSVATVETDQSAPDIAAQGILAILCGDPLNDARWLDLPCGPAVSCVSLREYKLKPDVTASGEEETLLTGEIQVHVPFPTGPFTAIFTLNTASMDYWGEFCDITGAVLQTVAFADPDADIDAAADGDIDA